MAIYHLNLRSIGRSTHAEGTAGAHVGYITRAGACRVVLGEHMPIPKAGTKGGKAREWLDKQEASDRKNARVIDKMNIALPIELDETERVELVRAFMAEVGGGQVPWLAAIHDKGKDAANPHAHIALRDRHIQHGKRHIGMTERGAAENLREIWERACNKALERKGLDERIDRRGLRVQRYEKLALAEEWAVKDPAVAAAYATEAHALDRKPQISVGPIPRGFEKRGKRSTVITRATRAREGAAGRLWRAVRGPDGSRTPEASKRAAEARRGAVKGYEARKGQEAAQRAAELAREAQRAEQAAEEARKAQEALEATQRASEEAVERKNRIDQIAFDLAQTFPTAKDPGTAKEPPTRASLEAHLEQGGVMNPDAGERDTGWKLTIGHWFRRLANSITEPVSSPSQIDRMLPGRWGLLFFNEFKRREGTRGNDYFRTVIRPDAPSQETAFDRQRRIEQEERQRKEQEADRVAKTLKGQDRGNTSGPSR
jgi:hypothetical protein